MLLVFGSLNVDLVFKVERLPRPGETVLCPDFERVPGGKGANQAAAAARAGAIVRMVGHLGDDEFGRFARTALADAGVDCSGVLPSARTTGIAVIGVDPEGENQITVASGANRDTHARQIEPGELSSAITLLCQNEARPEETFALIERARAEGARTILNLAPASEVPARILDAVDVLVVNEIEAAMAAGTSRIGDPADDARELARKHDLVCVVTLGARGAVAMGAAGGHRVEALSITPIDTTGAGDAFVGVLAAALDQGRPIPQALRRASVAAGLACLTVGAQTSQPSAATIEEHLAALPDAAPFA